MTPDQYAQLSTLLRSLATKYHIPRQALDDFTLEACKIYLEAEAAGHPIAEEELIRTAKRAYGHPEREPYQLLPVADWDTVHPPPDLWGQDDLRDALAESIQEAAELLGKDRGTGVLAYLLGNRDPSIIGEDLAKMDPGN